jgi:hypothetical protein
MKSSLILESAGTLNPVVGGFNAIVGATASVGADGRQLSTAVSGVGVVGSIASFLAGRVGVAGVLAETGASAFLTTQSAMDPDRHELGKFIQSASTLANMVSVVLPQARVVALGLSVASLGVEVYEAKQKQKRDPRTRTGFEAARNHVQRRDPLMLDLDGDGIELLAADGRVQFDHDADGITTGTGWVAGDDGLVVRDLNGNGTIDSGRELFGVDTRMADGDWAPDGFQALADLDSNGDGKFNASDAEFGNVKIWRDTSRDGISQTGELYTFGQLGISEINLVPTNTTSIVDSTGNAIDAQGTYTRTDGQTRTAAQIDFVEEPFYSTFVAPLTDNTGAPIAISPTAAALPDLEGSGMVRTLQQAATLSRSRNGKCNLFPSPNRSLLRRRSAKPKKRILCSSSEVPNRNRTQVRYGYGRSV